MTHASRSILPTITVGLIGEGSSADLLDRLDQLQDSPHAPQVVIGISLTDEERASVRHRFPHVDVIEGQADGSPSAQREAVLEVSRGDIVRFAEVATPLDPDLLNEPAQSSWPRGNGGRGSDRWPTFFSKRTGETPARRVRQLEPGDRAVVVGGGPAGLTAAYLLAKRGVDVTVLEGTDMVGGISQTAQYKGYRFDIGGHRFFTKYPPVQAMWEEVLGDEFISVPRLSRIFYNGKYFDYPLRPWNALSGLGLINSVLIVLSYLKAHFWPNPVEENFDQWVSNRFGKRLFNIFFKTYTEKVWGIPCSEIRAEWAAQRIQGLSLAAAILQAAALTKRPTTIKTLINRFQYPRLGPGQMWELCAERIQHMGGRVLLHHHVKRLELENGEVVAAVVDTPDGERRFDGEHFVSTMPVRSLVRAVSPAPPPEITEAAEGLRYRDFLVVALIVDKADLFPDNWIYIHSPGVKVGRIQNFNNWSQAMVPEPGRTCIGMEYFCFKGDGLWTTSDQDLIALATRELGTLGLAPESLVIDGAVIRMPKAYPIYDGAYREHLDMVRTWIDPIRNLHPVGRNGMHKYNNQDHSMLTSMMTIWNMEGASHDVWAVNTDFEYHEEMRVEESESAEAAATT